MDAKKNKQEPEKLRLKFDEETFNILKKVSGSLEIIETLLKENSTLLSNVLERPFEVG